jgi:hypothetical protein
MLAYQSANIIWSWALIAAVAWGALSGRRERAALPA